MKIYLGAGQGTYTPGNNTKVLTYSTGTGFTLTKNNILAIINETQQVTYFKADGSINFISAIDATTITFVTVANMQSTDTMLIVLDIPDNTQNQESGYVSTNEISPPKLQFDSVIPIVSTPQAFTTGWVIASSGIKCEGSNCFKFTGRFIPASLTSAKIKVKYKTSNVDTIYYSTEIIPDRSDRFIEELDTVDVGFRTYQFTNLVTQDFSFDVYTDLNVTDLEVHIIGTGTVASSSITLNVNESFVAPSRVKELTNIKLRDSEVDRNAMISYLGALRTEETTRLCGINFMGTTLDTNFWTSTLVNGTITQANNMVLLQTTTTANGSAKLKSFRKGRFLFACPNIYRRVGRLLDTGTTNNIREWGAYDESDGFFFRLSGTTFSINTARATTITSVSNGSFNVRPTFIIDTNVHVFEIHYFVMRVEFYIDGLLYHIITPTTATLTATLTLPIYENNTNSGGSTTNVQMECWNASIIRIGKEDHSTQTKNITGAATTICKYGAGHIDKLFINSSSSGTITIYDNTAASGTLLATINTPANSTIGTALEDINFQNGLTIVTSAAGHDITIAYE